MMAVGYGGPSPLSTLEIRIKSKSTWQQRSCNKEQHQRHRNGAEDDDKRNDRTGVYGDANASAARGRRGWKVLPAGAPGMLLALAVEYAAAGGAEIAAVMGHARGDTLNVGAVLIAEPHRVRLAGRALLLRPLPLRLRGGGQSRERQG
jgi:hypothetical protein